MKKAVPFALGVAIAVLTYAAVGWWLDSTAGVLVMTLAALAVAFVNGPALTAAAALWFGLMSGMAVVLIWMGPGNIWPIVLAIGGVITGASVLAGVGVRRLMGPAEAGPYTRAGSRIR